VKHTLCTPEDQAEWDRNAARKAELERELRVIEHSQAALAARTFEDLLRTGKWTVESTGSLGSIVPADKEAEDQVETIISTALKLGYHDRFTVTDGAVAIHGRVNDGALSLDLWPKRVQEGITPEAVTETFKTLRVDVDLAAFTRGLHEYALQKARRDAAAAARNVERLEAMVRNSSS
jgi:hypothetical protein